MKSVRPRKHGVVPRSLRSRSGSSRIGARDRRPLTQGPATPADDRPGQAPDTLDENIEAIKSWERAAIHQRSSAEQLSDQITRVVASGPVLLAHAVLFAFWVLANLRMIPGIAPFDPFPFQFLTMAVSLEAIFLSLFVIASQNRLAHQADKRAHLDLQIDLLAEREMTTVLRLLQDIVRHLEVRPSVTSDQIRDLVKQTDIHALTDKVEELPEDPSPSKKPTTSARE
jgi:uncharacterized membrane protein